MAPNIGTLQPADRQAIFDSAQRLGVDPYQLGAVINQESGFRPNVHGGAGGNYYGLIQFGPSEQKQYLDPKQINTYSIAAQMPAVESYLTGRGYKPGMGVEKLYATILGGNPGVSLTAKDAFGTSVASSLPGFQPGGASYKQAQAVMSGAIPSNATGPTAPPPVPNATATNPQEAAMAQLKSFSDSISAALHSPSFGHYANFQDATAPDQSTNTSTSSSATSDPILSSILNGTRRNYAGAPVELPVIPLNVPQYDLY
jgi:hypothetical protein